MDFSSLLTSFRGRNLFLPAHGRGIALPRDFKKLLRNAPGAWDLPELPDLGGPFSKSGALVDSQIKSAASVGVDRCWYGVNGATGLLQAALFALLRPGEAVLMPRNVHRSLIQACAVAGFKPVLFNLPFLKDRGHFSSLDKKWLEKVLNQITINGTKVSAAVLVHPTYHGYSCDIASLVDLLHEKGLPVLVDEAHGAYFASCIDREIPKSAISAGADLVVHSLHKSATGISQTAVLWQQGDLVDPNAVQRCIGWTYTSSPSALLLASCEAVLREWNQPEWTRKLKICLIQAKEISKRLKKMGLPLLENQDPLRLILHTAPYGIKGDEADEWLISKGLVAELPEPGCLTFCLGFASQRGLVRSFKSRWEELLLAFPGRNSLDPFLEPCTPLVTAPEIDCGSAWRGTYKSIPLSHACGEISAELICPYPPGIPLVIPGEMLDQKRIDWLVEQKRLWPNQISSELKVVI